MSKSVLIGMAIFSSEENKKDDCLTRTLQALSETVDFTVHKLILSVNAYTERTKQIIETYEQKGVISLVFWNNSNLGTAEAINKCWERRSPGQHCIKMDDDVCMYQPGWLETMLEVIERDKSIGQVGLKRKDCWENPYHESAFYKSKLIMLTKTIDQKWLIAEQVNHVMGTCVLHSSLLLDKVGYLKQPTVYGFDDSLMSLRSSIAGFKNVFLPQFEIDHIDDGATPYQGWKEATAGKDMEEYNRLKDGYIKKEISVYYNPFENDSIYQADEDTFASPPKD